MVCLGFEPGAAGWRRRNHGAMADLCRLCIIKGNFVKLCELLSPQPKLPKVYSIVVFTPKKYFFVKGAIPDLFFFIFVFSEQLTVNVQYKF